MLCRALLVLLLLLTLSSARPAGAHANLAESDPPVNGRLASAPEIIQLRFTESLEPALSRIHLRSADGSLMETPRAVVDPADPYLLILQPGPLADGLYSVDWRVVSAADGHTTAGSYAFTIGEASSAARPAAAVDESVPLASPIARVLDLISLSLLIGGLSFWLFVLPAGRTKSDEPARRVAQLVWAGWVLGGAAAVGVLLAQAAAASGGGLAETLPLVPELVLSTRFGFLWLLRLALWLGAGAALTQAQHPFARTLGLIMAGGILLIRSLFSHASGMDDPVGIAALLVHGLGSAVWVGGLVALLLVVVMRERGQEIVTRVGRWVGAYSNLARAAVLALVLGGAYSAWLHVGTVEALLTTAYGQTLLAKSLLLLPLLGLAAINLTLTARALHAGRTLWTGHLRRLVTGEIGLAVSIVMLGAFMTSGVPARDVLALRAAAAPPPSVTLMATAGEEMFHLDIQPGVVGVNAFTVSAYDANGEPISGATRIRLRFTHLEQAIGTSELNPVESNAGVYAAEGANLSAPGRWRIRMTFQRPGEFDVVTDFELEVPP